MSYLTGRERAARIAAEAAGWAVEACRDGWQLRAMHVEGDEPRVVFTLSRKHVRATVSVPVPETEAGVAKAVSEVPTYLDDLRHLLSVGYHAPRG